ncbi:uncharacterized protein LOC131579091 [Poecile atricapillus]|uniref:uncharacterized protein LOC131579091 n=1 Tax=Poecile atricapillus TaxID=48891 RepID=UPI0027386620|nr:uncharacterized protein LOC131579091 [Poecile atricapillus]
MPRINRDWERCRSIMLNQGSEIALRGNFSGQIHIVHCTELMYLWSKEFSSLPGFRLTVESKVHGFLLLRIPSRMQYSRWSLTRVESTGAESAPLTCCPHCSRCSTGYFLSSKCTLPTHVQIFIRQHPQVLLHRASLNPFIPQPVMIPGVSPKQVQDLALYLMLNLIRLPCAHFLSLSRSFLLNSNCLYFVFMVVSILYREIYILAKFIHTDHTFFI